MESCLIKDVMGLITPFAWKLGGNGWHYANETARSPDIALLAMGTVFGNRTSSVITEPALGEGQPCDRRAQDHIDN